MYKDSQRLVLSASDVVDHLACRHLTELNLTHLDTPLERGPIDETVKLLAKKGDLWERRYLALLKTRHRDVVEISVTLNRNEAAAATIEAMRAGVEIIYQATLLTPGFLGRTDFLRKIPLETCFGDWGYEVLDTKLPKKAKASHVLQLAFYTWLLAEVQGCRAPLMHVVLGDGTERAFRYLDYAHYFERVLRGLRVVAQGPRQDTYPDPCEKCPQCVWQSRCDARRAADDHLWEVTGIRREQIAKLQAIGITTLTALANAPEQVPKVRISAATWHRLRAQAALQLRGREAGRLLHELLPLAPERGFLRLPPPSLGDLYFDMEGDPHVGEAGLEYLFGVSYREQGVWQFKPFWGHDEAGEKRAFEDFVDFVMARIRQHPDLHVYHYADYERDALEKLMSWHATREPEVDELFRERRLVDLYRVVKEGVLASTPSYSIKEIEKFYRGKRSGEVVNAGASIVEYERWLETGDQAILDSIEQYNRDDCESTGQLHEWLLKIRPAEAVFRSVGRSKPGEGGKAASVPSEKQVERKAAEERARQEEDTLKAELHRRLSGSGDSDEQIHQARKLTAHLMDFHRRESKPGWWKLFRCRDADPEDLMDDAESIAALKVLAVDPPKGPRKRLYSYRCEYPEQRFKFGPGSVATRLDVLESVTVLSLDEEKRQVRLEMSQKAHVEPHQFSIGPKVPIAATEPRKAIARFAHSWHEPARYLALKSFLGRELPRLVGRAVGAPLSPGRAPTVADVTAAISALDASFLFIQGPPGAGKTYTASHVIVALLKAGKTVGISSNTHKAIGNLLVAIDQVAAEQCVSFAGLQKVSEEEPRAYRCITVTQDAKSVDVSTAQLVAGTAWLFAREALDQRFDYLFVDEAGQVSIANLIAMGVAAKNLVLLGDQMQLGQPIQGVHPGRSGDSVLEYLLDGQAVIAPERGFFLSETWRMHPAVCGFISEAVYDGQLVTAAARSEQSLVLDGTHHPALAAVGIRFYPVAHEGNSQQSVEEAREILEIYRSLLGQRYRDPHGVEVAVTAEEILVVAPYNMQVNLLKSVLPEGARVGTVDKFQGQEAAVVLVSLATSSGEHLPRDIEFLFSKNRINVALSRAKCLAVLLASPRLLDVNCRTAEEIALVNLLCWLESYASRPIDPLVAHG